MKEQKKKTVGEKMSPEKLLLLKKRQEITKLREELAAREEMERLQGALLAVVCLALTGEDVGVCREGGAAPAITLGKKAVTEALARYSAYAEDIGWGYRISFRGE